MTARNRQATVTAYYLGRPAALWRTALASRRTARSSASRSQRPVPEQDIR
jgi:hypothetical protein